MTTGFLRCPHCSSAVRPGAAWCSLCHADLRSDAEKAAAAPAPPTAVLAEAQDATAPEDWASLLGGVDPGADSPFELASSAGGEAPPAGRHARRTTAGPTRSAPVAASGAAGLGQTDHAEAADPLAPFDVDAMLAQLASTGDPLTGVAGRFSSKTTVALFAFGGAALLTVLCLAGMFILGSFLH